MDGVCPSSPPPAVVSRGRGVPDTFVLGGSSSPVSPHVPGTTDLRRDPSPLTASGVLWGTPFAVVSICCGSEHSTSASTPSGRVKTGVWSRGPSHDDQTEGRQRSEVWTWE